MAEKGKFIVFEGTDGSGKSTQIKLLAKYLQSWGVPIYLTCEPTDSPFGSLLRLCMSGRVETDERSIAALFAADRIDHVENSFNGILKKLDSGFTVLCDRFYLSSLAYNGGMTDLEWVIALNKHVMETARPDLTIFLDLSPEEGMRRVSRRGETDRYETLEKQKRIRERYLALFDRFPEIGVKIIQSESEKDRTQTRIRALADALFGFRK